MSLLINSLGTTFLYCIMACLLLFAVKVAAINSQSNMEYYRQQAYPILITVGIGMVFFAAFRDIYVGKDTVSYINRFVYDPVISVNWSDVLSLNSGEPLFRVFLYFVRSFTDNYHVLFIIIYTIITIAFLLFLVNAYCEYVDITRPKLYYSFIPILLATSYYINSWNVLRSWLAVAFTLFSFLFLAQDKRRLSLVLIIIAGLIHYTAFVFVVIWIAFILDEKGKILSNRFWCILFAAFGFSIIYGSASLLRNYFLNTRYISYVDNVSNWISFVPGLIVSLSTIMFSKELHKHGPIANACVKMQPFRIALMAFSFIGGSRIGYFFVLQDIYLISLLYSYVPIVLRRPSPKILLRTLIILFVIVLFLNNLITMAESAGVFPYKLSFG